MTDPAACAELVDLALKELGRVDILVNNAGITRDDLIMRMTDKAWHDVLDVNLTGAFNMTRAVLRPMIKARSGRIINMSSVSGQMGNAGQANYSASKAGLIGLTKATAREVASRGITVNAVAPGFVITELTDGLPDNVKDAIKAATPLGRFASVRRGRRGRRLPRLRRGRLHHGPGPRRRRRPRDDVGAGGRNRMEPLSCSRSVGKSERRRGTPDAGFGYPCEGPGDHPTRRA